MKKSLIIFLSLIFMSMTAHAVGVDCWEEVDATFNPNTVSKMQAVLGNNVTITRVKTEVSMSFPTTETIYYEGAGRMYTYATGFTNTRVPITSYLYYNYNGTTPYYIESQRTENTSKNSYAIDGGFLVASGGITTAYQQAITGRTLAGGTGGTFYNTSGYNFTPTVYRYTGYGTTGTIATFHYIHTYCVENTNSGGGGGGAAGAAVNYIIKAK